MKSRLKVLANWTLDSMVGAIGAGAVAGCLPPQLHNQTKGKLGPECRISCLRGNISAGRKFQ